MCLSGIAHFLLSNMRSRGGHSNGVRKQAVCTLVAEGERKGGRGTARIRQIMHELGNQEHGALATKSMEPSSHWDTESVLLVSPQIGSRYWNTPLGPFSLVAFGRRQAFSISVA